MTKDEALNMALHALESCGLYADAWSGPEKDFDDGAVTEAITAIKEALAQPEQRTWVHLTNEEHTELAIECGCLGADWVFYGAVVERKVREKNT